MHRTKNTFNVIIDVNNAAFAADRRDEVARILRFAAQKVEDGADTFIVRDINGNIVGSGAFSIFE